MLAVDLRSHPQKLREVPYSDAAVLNHQQEMW